MTGKNRYDRAHRKARTAALAALVDGTPCHFCGRPMYRADAANLHLDHHPSGTGYRGLAHARCNTTDGARRGGIAVARKYGNRWHRRTNTPKPQPEIWSSQEW